MRRGFLFVFAVCVLYASGFLYKETGPVVYSLISLATLSIPLLIQASFWKKIALLMPLLFAKVIGKYLLIVFGRTALAALMLKYGLLERRFRALLESLQFTRLRIVASWLKLPRVEQAYLIIIFLPVAIAATALVLFIKIVRLRMVRMMVENLLGRVLTRIASRWKN